LLCRGSSGLIRFTKEKKKGRCLGVYIQVCRRLVSVCFDLMKSRLSGC